jgi:hypothetical protein
MDAYDTGKGLPEQIDREGNTGFMQKIAAHPAVKPWVFTVSGDRRNFYSAFVHSRIRRL